MNYDKKIVKNKTFFEMLKIIHAGSQFGIVENDESFEMADALSVYQLVGEVMPALESGYEINQAYSDTRLNKLNVSRLIDALKCVKVFPELNRNNLNLNDFDELRKFIDFACHFQVNPVIKKSSGSILLIDKLSGCWKLDKEDYAQDFLNEYLAYRYKNQKDQQSHIKQPKAPMQVFSDYQDEAIEKIAQAVRGDISSLLNEAGMLYVVAVRITFRAGERHSDFNKIIGKKTKLLNGLQSDERIIYMVYKPFRVTDDTLEYYVVFFVQSASNLLEDNFVKMIETSLSESLFKDQDTSVQINAHNLNNVFRQSHLPSFESEHFVLIDGVGGNWEFKQPWFLDFLYQLERFGELKTSPLIPVNQYLPTELNSKLRAIRLNAGVDHIEPELTYFQANEVQDIQHLLFFGSRPRAGYIWNIAHLSINAKEYIGRISVIYQEKFAAWGRSQYVELAIQIEIFIFTLTENAHSAFYPVAESVRDRLNKEPLDMESRITRQLLQFAVIFRNKSKLDGLKHALEGKIVSKSLRYFFAIYAAQLRIDYIALRLEFFLGLDLHDRANREMLEAIISEYKFTQPLFFKPEPRLPSIRKRIEPALVSVEPTVVCEQSVEASHKLIHIQRHISRLKKVQDMLKIAMKTDVVIIRCLFCCEASTILAYKDFSAIFSSMLQDNKKRKPISEMPAYLGYWEGRDRNGQNQITNYAANVVLMFKAQVLLEYPDLFSELERAWQLSCQKFDLDCDPEIRVNGYVEKLTISHSLEALRCHQLQVETTQKKLSKNIIEHLASYMVYQDLLDDAIYQDLPKWLIKKNGTIRKPKTSNSAAKMT